MTCNFMSSITVYQSYQEVGRMMIKGYVQWNLFMDGKSLPPVNLNPELLD